MADHHRAFRPVRVAIFIDSLLAGGAERVAVETACGLDRTRFEPHIVVARNSGPLESHLHAAGIKTTILDKDRTLSPNALRHALAIARSSDLLHTHKYEGSIWGALLARLTNVPLIAHEQTWPGFAPASREAWYRFWIAPIARRIVCASPFVASTLAEHGVDEHLLVVVPNGVRLDVALTPAEARAELGLGQIREPVIGIVARLRTEKQHEVMLHAVSAMRKAGRAVHLCVVGDGPRRAELGHLAERLDIVSAITWAGERPDAARLVSAFDVSVICSAWEGLPLASLEALAAGIPVVATAVGGLPDLLAGGAGQLVASGDSEALAREITNLLGNPSAGAKSAELGRARIRESYSLGAVTRQVEDVWEEVLAERAIKVSSRGGLS